MTAQIKAPSDPSALIKWFNDGADGQIDWGSAGDFDDCVRIASDHMDEDQAKGFCNLRHQDAVGGPPGSEDKKAIGEGAGSGAALVKPKYGVGDKCPNCGAAMMRMPSGEVACPKCGYGMKKAVGFIADQIETKDAPWEVKEASGGLVIEGYASTWGRDRDGDTIDRKAFDRSLPAYLADNPVLLLDHDRTKVLGQVVKAWTDDIGLRIRGFVPRAEKGEESWKLTAYNDIKRGLRRALSIGGAFMRGKEPKAARSHIEEVDLFEISNIAVPSQPKALFQVVEEKGLTFWDAKSIEEAEKAADTADNRRQWAKDGKALPDGSFPILKCGSGPFSVGGAIARMGSGSASSSTIKAHIKKRAAALGCSGQLPDDWKSASWPAAPGDLEGCEDCEDEKEVAVIEAKADGAAQLHSHYPIGGRGPHATALRHSHPLPVELARHRHEGFRAYKHPGKEASEVSGENENGTKGAPAGDGGAGENGTGGGTGTKTVQISEAELKSLREGHSSFLELKRRQEIEETAEHIAEQRVKAVEEEEKKAAEEKSKFYREVAQAVDARLTGWRSGRKFAAPPSAGGYGAYSGQVAEGERPESMINLLYRKAQGDPEARTALKEMSTKAAADYGMKALAEGVGSSGYLVPPQYWQQGIAEYRIAAARVRQLCRVINGINSNLVYIPRETGIATVGWVADNAPKPSTDQTFGQLAVNIFTLAGISKVSNQLLEDSTPAVDQIVRADLGRLLGQAEDIAFLVGTGAGQPTGILNTAGILTGAIGGATLADAIATAIAGVQANYFGDPEAILMAPKHLNTLRTAKDANNRYIFEPSFFAGADPRQRAFNENGGTLGGGYTGMPSQGGPQGAVWGLPVYADANLPTPTNAGNALVAAFSECYVLERTGVTIDVSSEAGTSFEQNQTWFRGEERLGFTAARQPTAIYAITGLP